MTNIFLILDDAACRSSYCEPVVLQEDYEFEKEEL